MIKATRTPKDCKKVRIEAHTPKARNSLQWRNESTILERQPRTFIHVNDGTKFDIWNIDIIAHMLNFTIAAVAQPRL